MLQHIVKSHGVLADAFFNCCQANLLPQSRKILLSHDCEFDLIKGTNNIRFIVFFSGFTDVFLVNYLVYKFFITVIIILFKEFYFSDCFRRKHTDRVLFLVPKLL